MQALNDNNFKEMTSKGKVIIDFWANWCGVCKMIKPTIEKIEENHKEYIFFEANVDECKESVKDFNISNVPLIVFMEDGKIVKQGSVSLLQELQ